MAITFREDAMRYATSRLQGEVVVTSHVLLNVLTAMTVILLMLLCLTATAIHVPVVVRVPAKFIRVSNDRAMASHVRDTLSRQLTNLRVDAEVPETVRPGQSVALRQRARGASWTGQIVRVVAQSVPPGRSTPGRKTISTIIMLRSKFDRSLGTMAVIPVGTSLVATIVVGQETPFEWLQRATTRSR